MTIAGIHEQYEMHNPSELDRRGYKIYTMSQLMGITGRQQDGEMVTGKYEQPYFHLTLDERINIFRLCSPVHAVVSSRMNAISSIEFKVVCEKEREDEIADELKSYRSLYREYSGYPEAKYIIASARLRGFITQKLPEVLPDLSNFDTALLRYVKMIKKRNIDEADEVQNWLQNPNIGEKWGDFVKKMVFDYLIHGSCSIYKETMDGRVENIYILAGGTTIPLQDKYAGGISAYVQIISGATPQIYYDNELSYANYLPSSARAYGFVPLEALVNKVTESLLFDQLLAQQADGTKLPEKMIIITDNSPFGDIDQTSAIPLDVDEQQRIESKLNQPVKGAMMTFAGNGVTVVDLSRENTMSFQNERQKDIRSEVAMVFNATNMEMNLTGSENTSGRSTSEVQMEIMQSRGTRPVIDNILQQFNRDIIPFRFGRGFTLVCEAERSEQERLETIAKAMQTGIYSVNELRRWENEDPFEGEEFDRPQGSQPAQPDGSEMSPFNFKGM